MNPLLKFFISLFILFAFIPCIAFSQPVLIDTDLNIDDVMAILYLLKNPNVEVKAISIETLGTHYCDSAVRNALGILHLANQENIPVGCGPESPLPLKHIYYQQMIKRILTLSDTANLLPSVAKKDSINSVDLILKTLKESPEPITILAIGQLTNIAAVLERDPSIKKNIRTLVFMGGAVHVPGNVSENHSAILNKVSEWNIYIDAPAAKKVFNAGIPIRLISLDATNSLPIDWKFFNKLKKSHATPAAAFIYQLLQHNQKTLSAHKWFFWDPTAAVLLTDPNLASWKQEPLQVLLAPKASEGRLIEDKTGGQPVTVCQQVNKQSFESLLLKTIN
jgi:inosine-uridine nucleoside N-ribohydrolase